MVGGFEFWGEGLLVGLRSQLVPPTAGGEAERCWLRSRCCDAPLISSSGCVQPLHQSVCAAVHTPPIEPPITYTHNRLDALATRPPGVAMASSWPPLEPPPLEPPASPPARPPLPSGDSLPHGLIRRQLHLPVAHGCTSQLLGLCRRPLVLVDTIVVMRNPLSWRPPHIMADS